jgi:hypothetical protein
VHIVEPPSIWFLKGTHLSGFAAAKFSLLLAKRITFPQRIQSGSASSRCIFPFGFGQKAIGVAGFAREPLNVLFGVVPRNIDYGVLSRAPPLIAGGFVALTATRINAGIPFIKRNLVFTYRKRPCDSYLVSRLFVGIITPILRTHEKLAGGHNDHLGTLLACFAVLESIFVTWLQHSLTHRCD